MSELVLPAFAMDCSDWITLTPEVMGLPDEIAGAPLLAVLSTATVDDDALLSASCLITVGLFDDAPTVPVDGADVARELVEPDPDGVLRYVLPAPEGELALLAEFRMARGAHPELLARIRTLLTTFRWDV